MSGYNGWTNYETWNLALWIDNEEGTYNHWREQARDCWDASTGTKAERIDEATSELAQRLETDTRDNAPDLSGFYGDVLTANIGEVNWHEITRHWIEEIAEDEPEEPEEEEPLPSTVNDAATEERIRYAAMRKFGAVRIDTFYEHGHWWVRVDTGEDFQAYDVVDAEGPGIVNGFDFEEV